MPLRRAEIVEAALALADERGLDAVSMRTVAERVGVTPMALYPHVGGKAALLDAMLDWMLGQLNADPGGPGGGPRGGTWWQQVLREPAHAARAVVIAHPWAATLVFSRPAVSEGSVRTVDLLYSALLDAGVAERDVPRVERLLSTVVIGFAASEALGRFTSADPDVRALRGMLKDGPLPGFARLRDVLSCPVDFEAEFDADLDDLEVLVEAIAGRGNAG
jgi:AcrR family transcriptional regulator